MNALEKELINIENDSCSEAKWLAEFVRDTLTDEPKNYRLVAASMDTFIECANELKKAAEKSK